MPGQTLAAVAAKFQADGRIWLVDAAGNTHALDNEAYAQLTAAQLEGSRVFMSEVSAARFVATLKREVRT